MKMYRNYDGKRSTFGETSVAAAAPNPDAVSVFAAQRTADGAVTIMVINKQLTGSTPATISVANFSHRGTAEAWQLTSANAIVRLADAQVAGNRLNVTLPPQSITLFVVGKAVTQGPGAPTNLRIVNP
jgi:O-glycosyl hydrolase